MLEPRNFSVDFNPGTSGSRHLTWRGELNPGIASGTPWAGNAAPVEVHTTRFMRDMAQWEGGPSMPVGNVDALELVTRLRRLADEAPESTRIMARHAGDMGVWVQDAAGFQHNWFAPGASAHDAVTSVVELMRSLRKVV